MNGPHSAFGFAGEEQSPGLFLSRSAPQGGAASGPAEPVPRRPLGNALSAADINKLRWRCRRGLLENDLFIERFFRRHEETITDRQAAGLMALMDLADNDLLDLLLARQQPQGGLDTAEVREVLALLRRPAAAPLPV